jgi:hypothetical protein
VKKCKTCKEEKDLNQFGNNKYSKDGLNYICNTCRAEYELNRRLAKGIIPKVKPIFDNNSKECLRCRIIKTVDHFPDNTRGRLGKGCYCDECYPLYHKEHRAKDPDLYKEKQRISTQRYRNNNREHWRGLHRINQFNRKNRIKAVDDGTVTKDFMVSLYNKEYCYWCNKKIPENKRTAEHIISLIDGGIHGVSNLTMACISCNSSRLNLKNI